jgi:hypothetical protein
MNNMTVRASDYYATYKGREYEAGYPGATVVLKARGDGPPPEGFGPARTRGESGRLKVQLGELDRLVEVRTTCLWQGVAFEVTWVDGPSLTIRPTGGMDGPWLKSMGFEEFQGYGDLAKIVDISEVTDLYEEVTELSLSATI